ncbi:SDR family oxidoreductase [Streptosporangium sp. NPDC000396]|uniref:SDR family oxidoreductase n=1 Tax=Streptosporangium sp. NPDC000396 TaxID=3366185 RepID=UPI0036B12118
MKSLLVLGANGAQGGAVARRLTAKGYQVRGFGRATGDLGSASDVRRAFDGVTHASVVLPMVHEEKIVTGYVDNVIDAARRAGVERLVFNANTTIPKEPTSLPAFETRRAAQEAFLSSGVPTVVLRPPAYLENLLMPGLLDGNAVSYPLPPDVPVSWLAQADLAAATEVALTAPGLEGMALDLGGPAALTGPELAAALGVGSYRPLPLEVFESAVGTAIADIYRYLATEEGRQVYAPVTHPVLGINLTNVSEWMETRR